MWPFYLRFCWGALQGPMTGGFGVAGRKCFGFGVGSGLFGVVGFICVPTRYATRSANFACMCCTAPSGWPRHMLHGVVGMASVLGVGGRSIWPQEGVLLACATSPATPLRGSSGPCWAPEVPLKNCFRFKQGQNFELRVRFVEAFCGVARPREFDFRSAERSERH